MPKVKTIRIANPHKRRRTAVRKAGKVRRGRRPSRAKKNPWPQGVLTIMANTSKKRKKRNPFAAAGRKRRSYRRRRSNPSYSTRRRHSHRRRRNPFSVAGKSPSRLVTLGLSAGAGGIATRFLPNLLAKRFNEGLPGYGLNVLSAVLLSMLAGKTLGREEGEAVLLGGLAATGIRVWDDHVSKVLPIAAAVKAGVTPGPATALRGLGDASFSDDGLGRYESALWPGVQVGPGAPALPAAVAAYPQPF